ncbi:hypothetical protein BC941DRAFT_429351 [Chlamydoabsidia padenii]|nr:hypothetical protein BC941DRAFT_429351 [Chlamydoabsidia padenii]
MLLLTKNTPKDGVKLAPPIKTLSVLSFERHADQKLWYIIKVTPQQTETISNSQHTLQRKSYLIARRFDQFCTLDQQLHSDFSPSLLSTIRYKRSSQQLFAHSSLFSLSSPTTGPGAPAAVTGHVTMTTTGDTIDINDLPKLKLQRKLLPNKNIHQERQSELHRYCQELLRLPTQITQSLAMLEFFGLHKPDTERIVYSSLAGLSASRLSYVAPSSQHEQDTHGSSSTTVPTSPTTTTTIVSRRARSIVLDDDKDEGAPRLVKKAKSQPNFSSSPSPILSLPPSPPPLAPLLSTCHHRNSNILSPSYSTSTTCSSESLITPLPTPPHTSTHASSPFGATGETMHKSQHRLETRPSLTISTDRVTILDTDICSPTDILSLPPSAMSLSSPSSDDINNYLKLKVVYDLDNIILLQVPRTIRLPELRAKILHKFEDTATGLPVDFKLVFNSLAPGGRKDSLLSSSAAYSTYANLDARTIIGTQDDLVEAMSKWIDLPKVSVRCVVN